MLNYFMAQEAIASTEIESGPFTAVERLTMLIAMTSDLDMNIANEIAIDVLNGKSSNKSSDKSSGTE